MNLIRSKSIPVILVIALLIALFPNYGATLSKTNGIKIVNELVSVNERGENVYESTMISNEEKMTIKIIEDEKIRTVYLYQDGALQQKAINDKENKTIKTFVGDKTTINNVSDFITVTKENVAYNEEKTVVVDFENDEMVVPLSTWMFITSKQSPWYDLVGHLYGKYTLTKGNTYSISFAKDTLYATVLAAIPAWIVSPASIFATLGVVVAGGALVYAVNGSFLSETRRWDYEVRVNGITSYTNYYAPVYVQTHNRLTGVTSYEFNHYQGSYETYNSMIDTGIWIYAINYGH